MEIANAGKAYKSIAFQSVLGSCIKKSKTGLTLTVV